MAYHAITQARAQNPRKTAGVFLAKLAVRHELSAAQIAVLTGASRATVYNWFAGRAVSNAYKKAVSEITTILRSGDKEMIVKLKTQGSVVPVSI